MRNQGGELKLLHLTKKVNDLLQITKLTKLYTVFDIAGVLQRFAEIVAHRRGQLTSQVEPRSRDSFMTRVFQQGSSNQMD